MHRMCNFHSNGQETKQSAPASAAPAPAPAGQGRGRQPLLRVPTPPPPPPSHSHSTTIVPAMTADEAASSSPLPAAAAKSTTASPTASPSPSSPPRAPVTPAASVSPTQRAALPLASSWSSSSSSPSASRSPPRPARAPHPPPPPPFFTSGTAAVIVNSQRNNRSTAFLDAVTLPPDVSGSSTVVKRSRPAKAITCSFNKLFFIAEAVAATGLLNPGDLRCAVLVCRAWNEAFILHLWRRIRIRSERRMARWVRTFLGTSMVEEKLQSLEELVIDPVVRFGESSADHRVVFHVLRRCPNLQRLSAPRLAQYSPLLLECFSEKRSLRNFDFVDAILSFNPKTMFLALESLVVNSENFGATAANLHWLKAVLGSCTTIKTVVLRLARFSAEDAVDILMKLPDSVCDLNLQLPSLDSQLKREMEAHQKAAPKKSVTSLKYELRHIKKFNEQLSHIQYIVRLFPRVENVHFSPLTQYMLDGSIKVWRSQITSLGSSLSKVKVLSPPDAHFDVLAAARLMPKLTALDVPIPLRAFLVGVRGSGAAGVFERISCLCIDMVAAAAGDPDDDGEEDGGGGGDGPATSPQAAVLATLASFPALTHFAVRNSVLVALSDGARRLRVLRVYDAALKCFVVVTKTTPPPPPPPAHRRFTDGESDSEEDDSEEEDEEEDEDPPVRVSMQRLTHAYKGFLDYRPRTLRVVEWAWSGSGLGFGGGPLSATDGEDRWRGRAADGLEIVRESAREVLVKMTWERGLATEAPQSGPLAWPVPWMAPWGDLV
ncbi:hypothetical protein DFJ73DRAFT_920975 [Zopfochytrium polystomum]|nr:hypothetical protein DFJ73DRAFT_920975 [Zopfochytrium polystomum]